MVEQAIKDIRKTLILKPTSIDWIMEDKDFKSLHNNKDFQNIIKKYEKINEREK